MEKHPHAAAIDRIGTARLMSHFNIKKQAVSRWRYYGVPRLHHNTFHMIAAKMGKSVPEIDS